MKIFSNTFGHLAFRTNYITEKNEAENTIKKLLQSPGLYGIDIETAKIEQFAEHERAGLDPKLSHVRLVQIYNGNEVFVFDVGYFSIRILESLLRNGRFVAHNAVFEIAHLTHNNLRNINIGCSMLLSQLVEGAEHSVFDPPEEEKEEEEADGLGQYKRRSHSLDAVSQRLLGLRVSKTLQDSGWEGDLSTEQIVYAALDSVLTYQCAKLLEKKLVEYKMVKIYHLLKAMQRTVVNMELAGLPVDWEYHAKLIEEWQRKSDAALAACKPFFGEVNIRSGKQLGAWLQEYLKAKPSELAAWPKTNKNALAFSKIALTQFSHLPPIAALLEYKKYAKLLDTYGESLVEKKHPVTGRLHTSYTLGETRTGRLSSRTPNVQNFPNASEFRRMFAVKAGQVIVAGDFSQIELRLQAEFSCDPVMCEVFKNGEDIYKRTASSLVNVPVSNITKEQRTLGKIIALSLGYGMGPTKLGLYALNGFGLRKPLPEWKKAHRTYHTLFSVYSKWCERMRERAEKLGYIETLLGRRRKLAEKEVFTRAPNTVIQGSAAELMMKALLSCEAQLGSSGQIVGTVHDEILVQCGKEDELQVKACLERSMCSSMREMFPKAVSFNVVEVKIGQNWAEVK